MAIEAGLDTVFGILALLPLSSWRDGAVLKGVGLERTLRFTRDCRDISIVHPRAPQIRETMRI